MQTIFFNGQFLPVEAVADILRDNGRTTDYIFRFIGFRLGLLDFENS